MKKFIIILLISVLMVLNGCNLNVENENNQDALNGEPSKNRPSEQTTKQETIKVFSHDLVGKNKKEAIDIVNESKIKYNIIEEYNENTEIGYVISQSILPLTNYTINDIINITISKGSEIVSTPTVVAMTKEESISIIESKLLKYDIVEINNNIVQKNMVIGQNPSPNTNVKIGDTVTLQISLGHKQVQMGDLENHSEAYAKEFFSGINLGYTITYGKSNTVPVGMVMSQSVAKNELVNEGNTVTIEICDGLVLFKVDNYTGKSVTEVTDLLSGKCNIETKYDYNLGYANGIVIEQNIEAGNIVNIDNNMILTINNKDEKPVDFEDKTLEFLVRTAINKPDGQLYYRDTKNICLLNNYNIEHDKIKSLKGIENLTSLTNLYLFGEDITDVTPLANLTNLSYLNLECNSIEDISSLKNLVKMENIALSSNQITDISIMENMKELKSVSLSGCPIDSIAVIKDYTDIDYLNISNTLVSPQEAREIISKFSRLRALYISGIKVGDLEFLTSFTTTTHISVDNCGLDNIEVLKKFKYLESLKIYHNRIQDISPIKDLINLESLWVGYNDFEDISALENLIYLDYLFISEINTSDFSVLKNLVNLEDLYISSNIIDNVEFLRDLKYLKLLEIVSTVRNTTNYDEIISNLKDQGCEIRE